MRILLAFVFILFSMATQANDNDIAVMDNGAGGNIVLTQQPCFISDSIDYKLAYSYNAQLRVYGCWKIQENDPTVHVVWVMPDGESHYRTYNKNNFELMKII